MSFPMYRPAFMPGPASAENKIQPLLNTPLGLPARPLLPTSRIMPDAGMQRFVPAPSVPQMMMLPSTGMVNPATQNLLAFNQASVDNKAPAVGPVNSLVSSLPNNVQTYLNPAGTGYQGMNFGVLPPGVGGANMPMGVGNPPPAVHIMKQPPPPLLTSGQPPMQGGLPVGGCPESSDQEVDPDQPSVDPQRTSLDFSNSDLHLEISKSGYEAKNITDPPGFCFCWAGVRATHGVSTGKVFYEVRMVENLKVDFGDDHEETDPHSLRIGWSLDSSSLQLGEEMDSWGYDSSGKFFSNSKFGQYGETYALGDVIAAYLDLESKPPTMSFSKNGRWMGAAFPLYGYKVGYPEKALFPHILSKNCRFEANFGQWNSWCPQHLSLGHRFVDHHHPRVRGPLPPKRKADCEMIMIVGLPGAGKTTWGLRMFRENPDKCYDIVGTDTLIDRMRVDGRPLRDSYQGRWDVLIQKATACINKLFVIAGRRRRNYILDQTNVYASARKRKMKYFTGFRRICAVLQPEDEELKRREWKRTFEDGKVVPEDAVLEMKFNYSLPDASEDYVDEVIWIELNQQDSNEVVKGYGEEARMKLPPRKRSIGPDTEQSSDGKQMKMWEQPLGDMSNPPPELKYSHQDIQQQQQQLHHAQGFARGPQQQMISNQQEPAAQAFQQMPPVGVPPPALSGAASLAMPQSGQVAGSYDSWDGRLRMPGTQALLQAPTVGAQGPLNPFSVPDFSQPPPAFSMQSDTERSQQDHFQQWNPHQGSFSDPPTTGPRRPGDVDARQDGGMNLGDSDRRFGHDDHRRDSEVVPLFDLPDRSERFDYRGHGSRGGEQQSSSRGREGRFGEKREDWRGDRNSRREPEERDAREDNRWSRRDGRPYRRSSDRGSSSFSHPRGRGGSDRGGGRTEDRRWNEGRENRSGSRDRGSFQERSQRNRWEESSSSNKDDRTQSSGAPNRQSRALLGDSPQPLVPAEVMDKWKDGGRPPRQEGDSSFGPARQQQQHSRPPPNPRFSGPRTSHPPPPLRGPRPMPPRVPPPSATFRGQSQNWPRA